MRPAMPLRHGDGIRGAVNGPAKLTEIVGAVVASVKQVGALAPRRHQPRLGEPLEVVTHGVLAHGENLAQLQRPERIAPEHPQYLEPQRVTPRFEQGGEVFHRQGGMAPSIHGEAC